MRLIAVSALITAALLVANLTPAPALAAGDSATTGGASFDVTAQIGGRYSDPPGIWIDPCTDPYVFESSRLTDDAGARGLSRLRPDGVREYMWQVQCIDPETNGVESVYEFWVSAPTPGDIVLDLMEILPAYLDPPEVTWPNMSPEYGWLFVKVPMDFRINNLGPVTVEASVTNALGTVTASATATPGTVTFESGEGGSTSCSSAEAAQGYAPGAYGACSYEYQNSSAIAGGAFGSMTTVQWDITSAPADSSIPATLPTFAGQALAVSEVQAVVTCVGAGC